jgi:RNA recognition motif-containing protein
MQSQRKQYFSVVIDGLPIECVETDLIKLLQPCGKVNAVTVHRNSSNSSLQSQGLSIAATVEFQIREHAEAAVQYLESNIIWGRRLR